jgi:hypothetical protein
LRGKICKGGNGKEKKEGRGKIKGKLKLKG